MPSRRVLAGAIILLMLAQAAPAVSPAAIRPSSLPSVATEAQAVGQLQAENQALRAKLAKFEIPMIWYVVGFAGQFVFMLRFVVQWIASERKKQSVVPVAFWYLSLVGSLITLVYAFYRRDPVFTAAFCLNIFIYLRNLYFIHGKPKAGQGAAAA